MASEARRRKSRNTRVNNQPFSDNKSPHVSDLISSQLVSGDYKCSSCGKLFGNEQIFRLHSQIHGLKEVGAIQERIREQKSNLNEIEKKITAITNPAEDKKEKKKIGLTKVRMEDCLRCDACSCIYVDKNDYYKHMRNFHKITNFDTLKSTYTNTPGHFMLVDKPNNRRYKMLPFLVDVKKPENEADEELTRAFYEDATSKKSLSSTTLYKDFIFSEAMSLDIS